MIRVVLDTNVLISAHLQEEGLEATVFLLALSRRIRLCVSVPVLEEYARVLRRSKFSLDPHRITRSLEQIRSASRRVRPKRALTVCPDPEGRTTSSPAIRATSLPRGERQGW